MLFVVHALDKPDAHTRRMANYDAHRTYLGEHDSGVEIVMAGPLVADDGTTPIGSHFVLESPDRKSVEAFHKGDPFYKADIWEKASITVFVKRRG